MGDEPVIDDPSNVKSQLVATGYLAKDLAASKLLTVGLPEVLRERISLIEATIRSLTDARNRIVEALDFPPSDS